MIKNLSLIAVGAGAALALVLSCSDDSPGDADAAVCDCPTVETVVGMRPAEVVGSNAATSAFASCPAGSVLLGGGCEVGQTGTTNSDSDFRLNNAGWRETAGNPPSYRCDWINTAVGAKTVDLKAWAACQVP